MPSYRYIISNQVYNNIDNFGNDIEVDLEI